MAELTLAESTKTATRGGHRATAAACAAVLALAACAVNPATGEREISLVSESQEIALGKQTAEAARKSLGTYPDPALQGYVRDLGLQVTRITERPQLPWTIDLVDDAQVNAFAAPGGALFVTRGILAWLNSEAELVSVLGHEAGHVTARHSARAITRQQLAQVGLVAGSLISSDFASAAGAAAAGLQLLFLKHSRSDEAQADELGFRYMRRVNYDVRETPDVFRTLNRHSQLSGAGRLPTWQSSHPDPVDREAKAAQRAAAVPADSLRNAIVNRDRYLRMLEGIVYGENPRQGYFEANLFLHPDLRFRLEFPSGWTAQNRSDAVVALSTQKDAIFQLTLAGQVAADAAARQFAAQQGMEAGTVQRGTINGLAAAALDFRTQDQQGQVLAGRVTFLEYRGATYQLLGYTHEQRYGSYSAAFDRSTRSFRELTDPAALGRQPNRLRIVRVPSAMTIEEFHQRYPSPIPLPAVIALNGLEPGDRLPAGSLAKRVERP